MVPNNGTPAAHYIYKHHYSIPTSQGMNHLPEVSLEQYLAAEEWCNSLLVSEPACTPNTLVFVSNPNTLLQDTIAAASRDIGLPSNSLESLLRNKHVVYVKRMAPVVRSKLMDFLKSWIVANSNDGQNKTIVHLATELRYPPYLLARLIVERLVDLKGKKGLTLVMREPKKMLMNEEVSLKLDEELCANHSNLNLSAEQCKRSGINICYRLADEVQQAIDCDPLSGPRHEVERRRLGLEYEAKLEQTLTRLGIPFETEDELRKRGTSKTPDVLLKCPVGIRIPTTEGGIINNKIPPEESDDSDWKVVCWIDSKAVFGDVETHNVEVLPQAEAYVHRFGPGLILYWFGHAPRDKLNNGHGDISVVSWNLSMEIMLPTGEIL